MKKCSHLDAFAKQAGGNFAHSPNMQIETAELNYGKLLGNSSFFPCISASFLKYKPTAL
jgi:hypothetical protein